MTTLLLPPFEPDKSRFNPEATSVVVNLAPVADGWGPVKSLEAISDALGAECRGAIYTLADDGAIRIFAGTAANLYEISTTSYSWSEISRTTDDYSLGSDESWSFHKWGNYLFATAVGSDYPQFIELDAGTAFANLTNASFSAAFVWSAGDFLFFGRISGNNRKIKWSGVNDSTFWTPFERGSGEQTLPDGGDVMGGINHNLNALLLQAEGIRQLTFAPETGVTFRIDKLRSGKGVYAPRSIVNIGSGDFIFLAKDGFYRGVDLVPIGAERVDSWFYKTVDVSNATLVSGVADPFAKVAHWKFPLSAGGNAILSYDWQLDRWGYNENDACELLEAATPGYSLEGIAAIYSDLETVPYSFDSRFWKGGIPGFAGITSDYKFGFFDGNNLAATVETADIQLRRKRRSCTDRQMVLVDTDDATIAIGVKEDQDDVFMWGDDNSPESGMPWIMEQSAGRWHRFRVKIPAGSSWNVLTAIEVDHFDMGEY